MAFTAEFVKCCRTTFLFAEFSIFKFTLEFPTGLFEHATTNKDDAKNK
jgi:hypothetical protein